MLYNFFTYLSHSSCKKVKSSVSLVAEYNYEQISIGLRSGLWEGHESYLFLTSMFYTLCLMNWDIVILKNVFNMPADFIYW